jgi:hypothetical protein
LGRGINAQFLGWLRQRGLTQRQCQEQHSSPSPRAASMNTRRLSRAASCPTNSAKAISGAKELHNQRSSGKTSGLGSVVRLQNGFTVNLLQQGVGDHHDGFHAEN